MVYIVNHMTRLNLSEIFTVTFNSNVWGNVVDPVKREGSQVYEKNYEGITSNIISPLFFEGSVIFETIPKDERKNYIGNFKPCYKFEIEDEVFIQEGTLPFVLSEYLKRTLPLALDLGFKFIRIPRIGMTFVDQKYMSTLSDENIKERQERSFLCARFIENELGAGFQVLKDKLNKTNNGHLI